jgi:hypothetical protein
MSLTPGGVHEALDYDGLLTAARGPGCYALRLAVPDDADAAHRAWLATFDVTPRDDAVTRLAAAPRVAYVGAAGDVYDRLMDHAAGEVRTPAVCRAFPPAAVVGVYPSETPFEDEWGTARDLREDGWTCWVDGEVV